MTALIRCTGLLARPVNDLQRIERKVKIVLAYTQALANTERMKKEIIDGVTKAGYRDMMSDDGEHITVSILDSEGDECLAALRKHLPAGATAEYAGSSNTAADGDTTEDIRITWEAK